MPIYFGTLWPSAQDFSDALQRAGFKPLEGELFLWWIIFRNVQSDLQINAQTIFKAKYLTIQEWEILSTTYSTSKAYFQTSVADLVKQSVQATSSAYSAAEEANVESTKKFLIGENVNQNILDQGLIRFIQTMDQHFSQLARISPIAKLLREYRNRIALAIPMDNLLTDVVPPTFGVDPISTNVQGEIQLKYDPQTLFLQANGEISVRNSSTIKFMFPLEENNTDQVSLLYNGDDFVLNAQHQLSLVQKPLLLNFEEPLNLNNDNVSLLYDKNTLQINSQKELEVIKQPIKVGAPLDIVDDTIYLKLDPVTLYNNSDNALSVVEHIYDAPINKSGNTIRLAIDSTLGVDSSGFLYVKPLTYNEPLRLTNNTEVYLGYEAPLYQTTGQNLGVKIDNKTVILNNNNELEAVAAVPEDLRFNQPLHQNGQDISLNYASPLYMDFQNKLTLNYTPVFGLNNQQQLELNLSKPLILDSNGDLSLDYSGGITMLNSKLQLNLTAPFSVNNRQELQLNYNDHVFQINENQELDYVIKVDDLGDQSVYTLAIIEYSAYDRLGLPYLDTDFSVSSTSTGVNYLRLFPGLKTKIENGNNIANKLNSLNLQDLTTINNRLTEIEEESPCTDTIYHEDIYRFRNKIESGSYVRHDAILKGIPAGTKIVNVKGRFVIQHEGGNFRFCAIKLDQLQDFSFVTHPINNYYATYTSYFNDTQSYPVILRIYVQNGILYYNVYSENISDDGYNIFIEYQVIECDSQENNRNSWKLIKGNVHLSNVEWLYFFPSYLRLARNTNINISWDYGGESFTSGNFRVQYGTPVVLHLNNRSGDTFTFKVKNSSSFTLKCVNKATIRNLTINKVI